MGMVALNRWCSFPSFYCNSGSATPPFVTIRVSIGLNRYSVAVTGLASFTRLLPTTSIANMDDAMFRLILEQALRGQDASPPHIQQLVEVTRRGDLHRMRAWLAQHAELPDPARASFLGRAFPIMSCPPYFTEHPLPNNIVEVLTFCLNSDRDHQGRRCGLAADPADVWLASQGLPFAVQRSLLDAGVDVNLNRDGFSALHVSVIAKRLAEAGRAEAIELLFQRGVNVNLSHVQYGTAMHVAMANETFNDHEVHSVPRLLCRAMPAGVFDWSIRDGEGKTPLLLAAKLRSFTLVSLVMDQMALRGAAHLAAVVDVADDQGRTPLHFASLYGDIESARALLAAGASVQLRDLRGRRASELAAMDKAVIRATLHEIHVDADRDERALRNEVLNSANNFHYTDDDGPNRGAALRSQRDMVQAELPRIERTLRALPVPREQTAMHLRWYHIQCAHLTGRSLLTACLEGQPMVRTLLAERMA